MTHPGEPPCLRCLAPRVTNRLDPWRNRNTRTGTARRDATATQSSQATSSSMRARPILGRVTIGCGSNIGGNVWLTTSVPPGSTVMQLAPKEDHFAAGGRIQQQAEPFGARLALNAYAQARLHPGPSIHSIDCRPCAGNSCARSKPRCIHCVPMLWSSDGRKSVRALQPNPSHSSMQLRLRGALRWYQ